jgi:hypothetical protein
MANTKRNVGFRPYGQVYRATVYTANAAIYEGDAVQVNSSGNVISYAGASATPMLGVSAGYASGQGSQVVVWDHPDQQFVVQSDGSSATPVAQSDIFWNYQITTPGGSTQFKVSRMQLTATSQGTSGPLKAIYVDSRPDNALGTYADIVVLLNNHLYSGSSTNGI